MLFLTPDRADGAQLPTSVVKIDTAEAIAAEVENTRAYGPPFGLLHPEARRGGRVFQGGVASVSGVSGCWT